MRLDGIVDDAQSHVRCLHLDHGDFRGSRLVADLVHHIRSLQAEQTRHFNVDTGTGNALFPYAMLGNGLAKGDARLQALAHFLQRFFGGTNGAHAMVDAAWSKAPLRDFEPAPLAQQHIRCRNTDVFQFDFHMAVRRVVIAEDGQMAQNLHAGRIQFHQHHRLLRMALGFEIGLAHDNRDFAARVAGTG